MARTNNLTNFLTDVAGAIKTKKGSQTAIQAANFDTEILALPSQGTYQEKTVTITQNGQTTLTPDTGYDAMDQVEITVNVPIKQLQSKTVSVTSNGNVSLLPDTGYDGFNEVNLQVNVPTGGEINNQDKTITQNGTYTADPGYTGLGEVTVNVPTEGGSGDVKLFTTVEEMQADPSPQEGDLAVVYVNTIEDLTATTEFQKAMFPKTVVLSSSTSVSRRIELRIDPTNSHDRLYGHWNRREFYLNGWGSLAYDISYTSSDGLTYTLDTVNGQRVSSDTTIDFGVTLKFYSSSSFNIWRDAFGKFIQIINREFDGLFIYNTDSYQIAPTQLDVTPDYVYEKTYYGNNGIEEGTLTETPPSNSFADASAAVYGKTKLQYESMTPRVLTDSDKTIDKNIYIVPEKADGTPLLDTSAVTNMCYMFSGCRNLLTIALLDTSNVTNMEKTFNNCASLTSMPLLDTSEVTNMNSTFYNCSSLTTIPLLDTSKVTDMNSTFYNCSSLTTIPLLDTSNVTDMGWMFTNCSALSNTSLNNILQMCANASSYTNTKTLAYLGLTEAQATTCQSLSNYSAFTAAGWTTGY